MFNFLKSLFKTTNYKDLLEQGAKIIDVRSESEYKNGHIKGSENIPLQKISAQSQKIKALNCPIILCCASGIRSGQATSVLKSAGVNAINGGGWSSLNSKI
tara:strand:+ start:170 stop:472 length:303 start_codon:yes stop_codon:yes gene_type:complete